MNNLLKPFPAQKYQNLQYLPQQQAEQIQFNLLKKHLQYTYKQSPYYQQIFKSLNITPTDITTYSDFAQLPFTTKNHVNNHPNQFLAVDQQQIVDICLTSATSGKQPTPFLQTSSDLARLAYNEQTAFQTMNLSANDTLLICVAIDRCFMAGLAYLLGGVALGIKIIRGGSNSPAQLWQLIKTCKPTAIIGVPSLIKKIAQIANQQNENPEETTISKIIAIGEPTRNKELQLLPTIAQLEKTWQAKIFSTYASTELATTFCECQNRQGGHIRPELIYLEILDENQRPVKEGELGELIVTPLGVTGMPLIRYKSGDISFYTKQKCPCSRTSLRIGPIIGRKNQMLKYKGTTIYPENIIATLEQEPNIAGSYITATLNPDNTDNITVFIALNNNIPIEYIKQILQANLRVIPNIKIISKQQLITNTNPKNKRKRIIFFDHRYPL